MFLSRPSGRQRLGSAKQRIEGVIFMNKILIVDDEKSIRITLREFLVKEGYSVDTAADVPEADQFISQNEYDIVITDIIMPQTSGIELIESIRSRSKSVQLIVMTGEPTVDTAVKAVRSGANDYLTKPINKETLLKAVRQASNIKLLLDEKQRLEDENLLYQKNLEEILSTRTQALKSAMQGIVSLLTNVVETRDPYTAGHQLRVGNLSASIAHKMKLPQKIVDMIRIIGYIHDIGKIGVPIEILSKPGSLSAIEMEIIREHSQFGYRMLKKVSLPEIIANTVYQHHERCDGSGYPKSLTEDSIHVEAQIIMVADVVEAMISHRPYRPALGIEAAMNEITKNAGTAYNADVVAACRDLIYQEHYVLDDIQHEISFPL